MSDLGELLGTLMVSLAKARRIADAETAALAEWYKAHPLLAGVGVPRARCPEMVIEIPLLLKADDSGEPNEIAEARAIAEAARAAMEDAARRMGLELAAEVVTTAVDAIARGVDELKARSGLGSRIISREAVARVAETAVADALAAVPIAAGLAGDRRRTLIAEVRDRVQAIAEVKEGRPPRLEASLVTSEVKEKADPNTVTRIRLTLREEGLEWSSVQASDGTSLRRLVPE